jgi:opacity protein-like surface antigen/outer membrane receptor protein involved in Fe transport
VPPGTTEVPEVTVTAPPPPPPRPTAPAPATPTLTPQPAATPAPPVQPPPNPAAQAAAQTQALNQGRATIFAPVGTAPTTKDREAVEALPQGTNASFDKVLLQFPGVSQDSAASGNLHVRNEHANVSYRINGILLPDGLGAFGQFLDASWIGSISLITGALPAQFGLRTAGVVDITTATFDNTGSVGVYGGNRKNANYSLQYGGRTGGTEYFFAGRYLTNILGIENPVNTVDAYHDRTFQDRSFAYVSTIIDPTTRLSFIGGTSTNKFQIPNTPNQTPTFSVMGQTNFDSSLIDERQVERYKFGILALQKSTTDADVQLSYFRRSSTLRFTPDTLGDLMFNGVATEVFRGSVVNGIQGDSAFRLNESHTLRTGLFVSAEKTLVYGASQLLPLNPDGTQAFPDSPFPVFDSSSLTGWLAGVYLQDEWRVTDKLTLNVGGRFDQMWQYVDANQFSPRMSLTYKPFESTTFHAGYARYFTPPVQVIAAPTNTSLFTTCPPGLGIPGCTTVLAPSVPGPYSPMRPERAHVFDVGVTQKLTPNFEVGVDTYLKIARDLIDDGQFGAALVLNGFNYERAQNVGVEWKAVYHNGPFSAYANWAWANQRANNIVTNQYLFDPVRLAYTMTNWIYTDHAQIWTGSGGISYRFWDGTRFSADLIYGSGLRAGFANTDHNTPYSQVNAGLSHEFLVPGWAPVTARFDVINVFDTIYAIRNGTGIGVFAPQFGPRRAFLVGLSQKFGPGANAAKPAAMPLYTPLYQSFGTERRPLVTKAPAEAIWTWTGFYIGANAGKSFGHSQTDALFTNATTGAPLFATAPSNDGIKGGIGGIQAGFNWQLGTWLAGIEADAQGTAQQAHPTFTCPAAICNPAGTGAPLSVDRSQKMDWFGTIRGRLGVTVTPDVVAYVTGGLAAAVISHYGWINPDADLAGTPVVDGASANILGRATRFGTAVGGGVEARLIGNWTGKLEYLHLNIGSVPVAGINTATTTPVGVELRSRITDDIVRVGLNYKFDALTSEPPATLTAIKGPIKTAIVTKAPIAAAWSWSGYYLGLNVGYSTGKATTDALFSDVTLGGPLFATSASSKLNGLVGGAQTGYNWQFGALLAGVEADMQLTGERTYPSFVCPGTICNPAGPVLVAFDQNQQMEWFATLRGRLGVAVTPEAFLYATGGIAVGGFLTSGAVYPPNAPIGSQFSTVQKKPGVAVGAGIEGHIFGPWSGKIEYLHLDFTHLSTVYNNQVDLTMTAAFNSHLTDNVVRVGLNYKFDCNVPAVLK